MKTIPGGYAGKILRVDLTTRATRVEPTGDPEVLHKFLGGTGLGTKILFDETWPELRPFDPENPLIFLTGPLTGIVPTAPRYFVVGISPVTGAYGESNSGGYVGTALKKSGFDGVIVTGKAKTPVYLWIHDHTCEIKDASQLWGRDAYETEDLIRSQLGVRDARVAAIGPAGERLVLIASIMNDGNDTAARCGFAAVMGSKNLKALAVKGNGLLEPADPDQFHLLTKQYHQIVKTERTMQYFTQHGTNGIFEPCYMIGDVPIKNFTAGTFPGYTKLTGEEMTNTILLKRATCFGCPIACKRIVKVSAPGYEVEGPGPEYEGVASLGPTCGNDSLEVIAKGNELCNRYGLDVISTGVTIAFLMECFEKGLLTVRDTGGLSLRWGSPEAILGMIRKIGEKEEGIGELAGQGVRAAAEKIGKGAERFAMHVKGVEMPMHDGRALKAKGLGYAISPAGARANSMTPANTWCRLGMPELMKEYDPKNVGHNVELCVKAQNIFAVMNSTGLCMFFTAFPGKVLELFVNFLSAVTGWEMDLEKVLRMGDRIVTLQRVFNIQRGLTPAMDTLPKRFTHETTSEGGAKGDVVELDQMLPLYYRMRDWDPSSGMPSPRKLADLEIDIFLKR